MLCMIRGWWRTIRMSLWFGSDFVIYDGHEYVEQDDGRIICRDCGRVMP